MKKLSIILVLSLVLQNMTPMSVCAAEVATDSNSGITTMVAGNENVNEEEMPSTETLKEGESVEKGGTSGESTEEDEVPKDDETLSEDESPSDDEKSKEDETPKEDESSEGDGTDKDDTVSNEDESSEEDNAVEEGEEQDTEVNNDNTEEEIDDVANVAVYSVDTQNATEIEGFIQDKYYRREDGYSLFIGAAMPEWGMSITELTNVAYRLDSGTLVELGTVPSDKFEYYKPTWSDSYGGCLTLSLDSVPTDATEGVHTLTVYFTAGGTGYKVVGTTELVDEIENEGVAEKWSKKTEYISSKAGASIEMIYASGYTLQKDEEWTKLQLVPSGSTDIVLETSVSYTSSSSSSDRYSLSYTGKDGLWYNLKSTLIPVEYRVSGWFNDITLTKDIVDGYYDVLVFTSTGRRYREKNAYYASGKSIVYSISQEYADEWYNGEQDVFCSDDTGDYVSVFVYGLNLNKNNVPTFYNTDGSMILASYIANDAKCGYEYGNKWGNFYRLKKTRAGLGVDESARGLATVSGDVIYANKEEYCETSISSKGIFFEEYLEANQHYDGSPGKLRLYIGEGINCDEGDTVVFEESYVYISFSDVRTYSDTAVVKRNENGKYIEFGADTDIYKNIRNTWNYNLYKDETLISSNSTFYNISSDIIQSAQSLEIPAGCSWEIHAIGEITNTLYSGTNTGSSAKSVLTKTQLSTLTKQGTVRVCIYNADGSVRERKLLYFWNNPKNDLKIRMNTNLEDRNGNTIIKEIDLDWNDAWFLEEATSYNHDLARTSIDLCGVAYTGKDAIADAMEYMDFIHDKDQNEYNYDTPATDDNNDIVAYSFGQKKLEDGCTLVAIIIRGTSGKEWYSNFNMGTGKTHSGFQIATSEIAGNLNTYLAGLDTENVKCFVTGHSRGAAVANLLAASLTDRYGKRNVYAYTFATPAVSKNGQETGYENIFNIVNGEDFVTRVPIAGWGYSRYGFDLLLPSKSYTANSKSTGVYSYSSLSTRMRNCYNSFGAKSSYVFYENGTQEVDRLVNTVYALASNTDEFYNLNYLNSNYLCSLHDYFEKIAGVLSRDGIGKASSFVGLIVDSASPYFTITKFFWDNYCQSDRIFSAHSVAGYYSWMVNAS